MKDDSLYIPVHAGLWEHPKTKRLARRFNMKGVEAVGHLVALWTWAVRYAPDGDLSEFDDLEIEDAAQWDGDDGAFAAALRDLEWITDNRINDWEHYAGEGLSMRAKWREQKRAQRGPRTSADSPPKPTADASCDVRPERDRIGTGSGTGPDRDPEESALAPAVDRSRQSPGAPPPLPGHVLTDDEIAAVRAGIPVGGRPARRLGYAGVGFMEDPAKFPQDADELIAQHRADLAKNFPMLDGKPPRPSLRDAVASKWGAYVANRARNGGHANAYSALKTWLGEMAQKHRVSWEREHSTVVDDGVSKAKTREILKPLQGPHPSDDPEAAAEAAKAIEAMRGIGKRKEPKP